MRVILLLLSLSGCAGGVSGACRPEKLAELPVQVVGNVPVVRVEINGQQAALVLDTGSDATILTRAAAARLGVVAGPESQSLGGAGGRAEVGVAQLDRVGLGPVVVPGVRALLGDAPRPPLDGVLGINVLVGFEVELDMPRGVVALYRARPCATAGPAWVAEATQLAVQQVAGSGHLFVPVELDGQGLRGVLDTGASGTTVSLQSAEDAGVTARQLAAAPVRRGQAVNAEGLVVRRVQFRSLKIGPDVLDRPALAVADLPVLAGDMLVGGDYLGTRRVWFSFLMGRVFVSGASGQTSVAR